MAEKSSQDQFLPIDNIYQVFLRYEDFLRTCLTRFKLTMVYSEVKDVRQNHIVHTTFVL